MNCCMDTEIVNLGLIDSPLAYNTCILLSSCLHFLKGIGRQIHFFKFLQFCTMHIVQSIVAELNTNFFPHIA